MTQGGRDRLAGQRLVDAATAPNTSRLRLAEGADELVPGSAPTTFQQTGDLSLGSLERGVAARNPDRFAQRRADQNSARLGALESVQPAGAPETVARAVKARMADIDAETQSALDAATNAARQPVTAMGTGAAPASVGDTMRQSLESARAVAKARERQLWEAVDPDGTLAVPASSVGARAAQIRQELPVSAKPPSGEEAAILDVVAQYPGVVPFKEIGALQSRLKAEMRAERMVNGESPAYRRLSMLNASVEADLDAAISTRATEDAAAVRAGRMAPDQTLAARLEAVAAPSVGDAVYTPGGRRIGVRYEVVDASSLRTSNTADGRPDPAYPVGLQPRDRSRAVSDTQIANISRNLQPERLGPSSSASEGAPIVGPDGVVESGNGRVLGIRGAYRENGQSAKAYREYLAQQGYDVSGMREPVLVRRRTSDLSDVDRQRFAQESNASSSLTMSASEQAATDASRLDRGILDLYRGGDVASAENRDFARAFLGRVAEKGQEGSFATGGGTLSLDGAQRMRNALLQSAYRDGPLVASLVDAGDDNIRAFGRALSDISGDVAKLRAGIDAGDVDPVADVSQSLVEAARVVSNARDKGIRLADAVAQQDAFSRMTGDVLDVLEIAYGSNLSGRLSREKLVTLMRDAVAEAGQQTAGARLFGESLDAAQIFEGLKVRNGSATISAQGRSIDGSPAYSPGRPEVWTGEGRPGVVPPGQEGARGIGSAAADSRILERPALAPNFDGPAKDRLNAARGATKDRVETFDNRTLGPIRKRPGTTSPYDMPAATVPARIFFSKPESGAAIARFRSAVGDEQALPVLREYAVDRLRAVALRDDGTLDPAKLASWRRLHADALRALPDLDAQLSTASRASEAVAAAARARRVRMDEFQVGKVGALLGVDDPADVVRTVGGIFGRQDAVSEMQRLRAAVGSDPEAREGLRKAVVDYVKGRFVSNTEVATSGQAGIKSDGFQSFVRQSEPALRAAGFGDDEISTMQAIADDLQRANRSIAGVRIPGGSNTAQDLAQMTKGFSLLGKVMHTASTAGAGAGAGYALGGGTMLWTVAGAIGAQALTAMRSAGLETVDDLVADAMLNPARAKLLMGKARPDAEKSAWASIADTYGRAARTSVALGADRLRDEMDAREVEREPLNRLASVLGVGRSDPKTARLVRALVGQTDRVGPMVAPKSNAIANALSSRLAPGRQ